MAIVSLYTPKSSPHRSELFSSGQMKKHGNVLAVLHQLTKEHRSQLLLTRLTNNEKVLISSHTLLTAAVKAKRMITPAGEWLLDNFYVIEEQIYTAKRHLPKSYHRELPLLINGSSAGLPRVYDIAMEIVAHGDGRFDAETLSSFMLAYQKVTPLNLGELWAIPIMLRLALIENIRRIATLISSVRNDQDLADDWVDRILKIAQSDPKSLILVVSDMIRAMPPMSSAFVAELTRRLQGQPPTVELLLTWINQWLSEENLTIEQLVQSENQNQAAIQVAISNSIGSLRLLGTLDWREFVETMSGVEQILKEDPSGVYRQMNFSTRDSYRHSIENIAKSSPFTEVDVAQKAIHLAEEAAASNGQDDQRAHVGFYLIDEGLPRLEKVAKARIPAIEIIAKMAKQLSLLLYLSSIAVSTFLLGGVLWINSPLNNAGIVPVWERIVLVFLLIVAISQLVIELVNSVAMSITKPHSLPSMDFSAGIPSEFRTLTVVPTMITSPKNIEDLIEGLEVTFLANRDEHFHFGLLTDFRDAKEECLPQDTTLLKLTEEKVIALNAKYKKGQTDIFFLFHRPRRWNANEKVWMGYERKRGKLGELNELLRGGSRDKFSLIAGDISNLMKVKYIITLDMDTHLPRDSGRHLVETMAHPLNRNRYSILQPRLSMSLSGANRSFYARLYGGEPGIDPYTRTVSDVYQDLFGEGSYIGKGIYDLDKFEQALRGHFPEGKVLSHDLLEGCYAHSGLLSDVELYEDYPSQYFIDVARRHRWIRGDWQLLGVKKKVSLLSRWKIMDNLRRSLVPAAFILLIFIGWALSSSPYFWLSVVLWILFLPPVVMSVLDVFHKAKDVALRQHLETVVQSTFLRITQRLFTLACLPYEAFFSLDAIARTLMRIGVTHKRLLEWRISTDHDEQEPDLLCSYRRMWIAPVMAVMVAILSAPLAILWACSPTIAWWVSRPLTRQKVKLSAVQHLFLRKLSRKIWGFFEAFMGPDDHWLPPDNYQQNRVETIAHRTSPTNIGLALLSNLSAYDFGYITAGSLIERTQNTFRTLDNLKRYRGHFYNWYDTQTLQPLLPIYISTVDSGNLAGFLLTLQQGLIGLIDDTIVGTRFFEGLRDTLTVALESIKDVPALSLADTLLKNINPACERGPLNLDSVQNSIELLKASAEALVDMITEGEAMDWLHAFVRQCSDALNDLIFLVPKDRFNQTGILTLKELAKIDGIGGANAKQRLKDIESLARQSGDFAQMKYDFLFDATRQLLSIGYHLEKRKLDHGYYDLLASEARLCYFTTIAQRQVPLESWFTLGRLLTTLGGKTALLSWSGSMFEYLMPLVVMPTYDNTLLEQTYLTVVERQIEYGNHHGVAWGMSESGYNAIDTNLNYQYRAFGVPGLGLKRGLSEDLVVSPYASVLALMISPEQACLNLQRLENEGGMGKYGLYEAVDYSPSRQPRGQSRTVLQSFMAHHQGMSLLSLGTLILDRPMQKRFAATPIFQAILLLLQEKIPSSIPFHVHSTELAPTRIIPNETQSPIRILRSPHTHTPEVHLLSNGRYHVMVTQAGGGYSHWKDLAVTRWREDTTRDNWGIFCYIRDLASDKYWSTAYQPTCQRPDTYEAIFSEGRAEFCRRDKKIETYTEIVV